LEWFSRLNRGTASDFEKAVSLSAIIAGIVTLVGSVSNALGGALSDRFGRANTIIVVLLGSSLLSVLYGFMVTGESSVLSTGVTELAPPGGLGRTMAFQSLFGFGAASLSPIAFGYILDIVNPGDALARLGYIPDWGFGFTVLGVGGLVGPLAIWRMKKEMKAPKSFSARS